MMNLKYFKVYRQGRQICAIYARNFLEAMSRGNGDLAIEC